MSLQACADIVQKSDPVRFQAAMAAPVESRRVLFPLYAFNVEVARAPWVTEEPTIAEMRLQWWRDVLDEIKEQRPVRRHEVSSELANVLHSGLADSLDRLVQARRWDIYKDPFEDADHFDEYLKMTGGLLMWMSAHLLGARINTTQQIFSLGRATALARFLQAVPALESHGRIPLVDGRETAISELAHNALNDLPDMRKLRAAIPAAARGALIEGWQTEALLRQVVHQPARVAQGAMGISEFKSRWLLFRWA